ncbi:hypothetical protein AVEN_171132-1 [Araneus ventricosus]|uniref:Uncharacterized protein n=1 Tax=Araneus ventricosus TaxID=182803 RepID=A0A4Y2LSW8_ARAVE|nr:hypothetical protein AVEN_171132-1 [Araneus ventricosus]
MTPCGSNNSTSPLPSPLHSCLVEAPMQSMIWAGEAGQEQGQEEKVLSLSMNFKFLMCPLRNLAMQPERMLCLRTVETDQDGSRHTNHVWEDFSKQNLL